MDKHLPGIKIAAAKQHTQNMRAVIVQAESATSLDKSTCVNPEFDTRSKEGHVDRLIDARFPIIQRQTRVSKIGQVSGNSYLSRVLSSTVTDSEPYVIQRDRSSQDIETNVMDLTESRQSVPSSNGRRTRGVTTLDERSVRRIQHRLIELRLLQEDAPGFQWGQLNEVTQNAIRNFQQEHSTEINDIKQDIQAIENLGQGRESSSARQASANREGTIRPNDATNQALANAWPRSFFGVMLENEAQAYTYIANQVEARGLPFDRNRVNIVGVRGFQGGNTHDNNLIRRGINRYDDSFFVLALNENEPGEPKLREFRGTTDPGGRSDADKPKRPGRDIDTNTYLLEADQQLPYRFGITPNRNKSNRPMLEPQTGEGPEGGLVVDPHRGTLPTSTWREGTSGNTRTEGLAAGVRENPTKYPRYDRARTIYGNNTRRLKSRGIAIHSGAGDVTTAYSTGCQVIHGDWYGSFIQTLRRALTWGLIRNGLPVPRTPDHLATAGFVLYSILDGHDLQPPNQQSANVPTPTLGAVQRKSENEDSKIQDSINNSNERESDVTRLTQRDLNALRIQRHQNHEGLSTQQRYEHTLAHAGTTKRSWEDQLDISAKFLGIPISRGIHQELADRLVVAERYLRTKFPNQNDEDIARSIGIYSISGLRSPRNAAAGSRITNHAYGIAIDVNYLGNPFLGQNASATFQIIRRATSLVLGQEINMAGEQSGSVEEIRKRYELASTAFKIYFGLQNDQVKLKQFLDARGRPSDPRSITRALSRIRRDCSNPNLLADFATDDPRRPRDPAMGFMDLGEKLIEALVSHADLFWGGQYRGGKDLMHFDWRGGTIQESHRL